MARLHMQVESGTILINLVEHDMVRRSFFDQDIETIAAGFVGNRLAGVVLDQPEKRFQRAGVQIKIHGDDVAGHWHPAICDLKRETSLQHKTLLATVNPRKPRAAISAPGSGTFAGAEPAVAGRALAANCLNRPLPRDP